MYYDHVLHIVLSRPHLSQYVISTSYDIKEPRVEVIAILNSIFHLLVVRLYYIPLSLINTDIINIGLQLWSVYVLCSLFPLPLSLHFPNPPNPTPSPVLVKEFFSQAILHFEEDVIGQ